MARPTKGEIVPDQDYLKEWGEYAKDSTSLKPILLPISVNIKRGIFKIKRIKATKIADKRTDLMMAFKGHCHNPDGYLESKYLAKDFETMLDEYIEYFEDDFKQSLLGAGPLDIKVNRPVWILYYLPRKEWTFSEDRQFSTENDRDDFGRNFEKIMTFENKSWLLLANHCRSSPEGLKFNLHVTITQPEGKTPIIIDPGSDNGPRGGAGQQGLP